MLKLRFTTADTEEHRGGTEIIQLSVLSPCLSVPAVVNLNSPVSLLNLYHYPFEE